MRSCGGWPFVGPLIHFSNPIPWKWNYITIFLPARAVHAIHSRVWNHGIFIPELRFTQNCVILQRGLMFFLVKVFLIYNMFNGNFKKYIFFYYISYDLFYHYRLKLLAIRTDIYLGGLRWATILLSQHKAICAIWYNNILWLSVIPTLSPLHQDKWAHLYYDKDNKLN